MKEAAVGIDIGGTNIKLGLVDRRGRILARSALATTAHPGRRNLFRQLCRQVEALIGQAGGLGARVCGIGIGAPGPIDVERGFVYFFPNIRGWKNTPLKKIIEGRFKKLTCVDNDANVMALAEFYFGAGKGARDLIALTLGTGVGGGMIIRRRLFHGNRFSAAEIGHMTINEDGPLCACGNRGCIEAYVGNNYFIRWARGLLRHETRGLLHRWVLREKKALTPELVQRAAGKGDVFSKKLWEITGAHLGTVLAGLVNILNPERIIIGGGIAQAGSMLFNPIRRSLKKKAFPIAVQSVKVLPAKLGQESGLVGAAALVFAELDRK